MAAESQGFSIASKWQSSMKNTTRTRTRTRFLNPIVGASQSTDDKDKVFKQLGMFSLRKKIEDAVLRAEMLAPSALELEEDMRMRREQIRDKNLWDDIAESDEMLARYADSVKVVNVLRDLAYKTEEAKLIKELAETDAVDYKLFKQAYNASVDVSKLLDWYHMSKLLRGAYDMHGASVVIKAGDTGIFSEIWAERLLSMYLKWAEKQGYKGRVVEKCSSRGGGIKSATIEFEFEFAYGCLIGERGVHRMMGSPDGTSFQEASLAAIDVIPLFRETSPDLELYDNDLVISYSSPSSDEERTASLVHIQHSVTGICVQSSGERNKFVNKMKALNRLKARLLVIMMEQGVSDVRDINRDAIIDLWKHDTRKYMLQPYKLVEDLKTGVHLSDLNSVLDGNIDLLVGAHVSLRHASNKT